MDRRKFIIGTTIAGTSLLTRPPLLASTDPVKKKPGSVIIIGAGFAGLTTAHLLARDGINVTVLEARNRIGGRVYSFKPSASTGHIIELGAEWVGNSHTSLINMCKDFGLELDNNQFETALTFQGDYQPAGKWELSKDLERFWSRKTILWEDYSDKEKRKLDRMDWWRFLSNQGFSDRDLMIRELTDSTDFGESIRHTSGYAAFAEYAESSEKNEMDMKIKGGNNLLAQKLADAIGRDRILLDHKVTGIEQSRSGGVKISCANGKSFSADKLVCTVPTYSLMRIQWKPGLPAIQWDAMNTLQYARIVKFPMEFKERFWKHEDFDMITDTPAHYFYHGTKNQQGPSGILISYVTGDKADTMTSVPKKQREDIILEALRPAFGDVRKYLTDSHMYYWGTDPYSKGAYAFYGKGQWFDVMPILREPYIHTHFAGEHLADWQGFMEGAINTGEEVAAQLGVKVMSMQE